MEVRIANLGKVFRRPGGEAFIALEQIDLVCAEGEIVSLIGPSGCGKTTLLNIVAGLTEPSTGTVEVAGRPVTGPGPERGVIFQQYALFPWMTVRDNVEFGLRVRGDRSRSERTAVVDQHLEMVGLRAFADALPKELSGGMKQRCAIARAYAVEPVMLLMDEPFGAVDALTRVSLQHQLLETWEKKRTTIIFVTHDVDEAVFLSHRVVVMGKNPGRINTIIETDLPYPRTQELRLSPDFVSLRAAVWREVHEPAPQLVGSRDTST